jgi:hypothetical protein
MSYPNIGQEDAADCDSIKDIVSIAKRDTNLIWFTMDITPFY